MKSTLVTGGMGFIGKVLVNKILSDTDRDVIIVDNLSSSKIDDKFNHNPRITFIQDNFENWDYDKFDFDQIYHLTSPVGPLGVLKYKGLIAKMILEQLYRAAEIAISRNAKLVEISTSEVYGAHPESEIIGQREDLNKIVPSNLTVRLEYGVGKLLCEIVLANLARDNNLKYVCIRPFNIVGPKQNDELGFIIPRFLRQINEGKNLTVYGDGSQKRTFTHVEDFVDGTFKLMESNVINDVFNIGNPANVTTILNLAEMMISQSDSKSKIDFVDPKYLFKDFSEAWNKIPNIDKIKSAVDFEPKIGLDYIVNEAIQRNADYLI